MSRVIVVVPTYDEIENLPQLVPQILEQDPRLEVLVVDDNSPDGTGKLAEEMALTEPRVGCAGRGRKLRCRHFLRVPAPSDAAAGSGRSDHVSHLDGTGGAYRVRRVRTQLA